MTDAHCHLVGDAARHFLCEPFAGPVPSAGSCGGVCLFFGTHPWHTDTFDASALRARLAVDPSAGVGEIGLDRLREREIPQRMRDVFAGQLEIAAEFRRPVALHGAKCWGEVVKACLPYADVIPAFLFHGFSRSDGLLPDIIKLNGYISVGPAVLNDHAVNYRGLVKKIPPDRLLVETDRTAETAVSVPSPAAIAAKIAELRGVELSVLERELDGNADRFINRYED